MHQYPNIRDHILFIHAFTGCDTTSTFYNRGKLAFVKTVESRADVQKAAEIFKKKNVQLTELAEAGVKCVLALYKAPESKKNFDLFRYTTFIKKVKSKSTVKLASLPPTSDAAMEHFKRVNHQIQAWMDNKLPPEEWGWKM